MRTLAAVLLAVTTPALAVEDQVVLLDFTAPYCGPCKAIQPHLDELARQGYPIRQVNISANPQQAAQYKVRFVPTFVLLVNGQERWRHQGTEQVGQLKNIMDQALQASRSSAATAASSQSNPGSGTRSSGTTKRTLLDRMFNREPRQEPEEPEIILGQQPEKSSDSITKTAMAASVRIRVTYDGKVQFGSGTIVHSKKGETIILTCAHIMDQAGQNPKVEVDVFNMGKSVTYFGKVVGHDIKSDVGIITVPTPARLPVVEVTNPSVKLTKGQKVFSIGCDNGKEPTRVGAELSGIDRYLGPNNLETNLAPEHGRSGGALFDSRGRVIGVCSAADRKGNHGLYAGNRAIFAMLKKHKMLQVYGKELAERPSDKKRTTLFESDGGSDNISPATLMDGLANSAPASKGAMPRSESAAPVSPGDSLGPAGSFDEPITAAAADSFNMADAAMDSAFDSVAEVTQSSPFDSTPPPATLLGAELAGIPDQIHNVPHSLQAGGVRDAIEQLGGDAEVTVIIRPRDPQKASQIVVIPHATSNFVAMLKGEMGSQPTPTSFVRPVMEVETNSAQTITSSQPTAPQGTNRRIKPILKLHTVGQWIDREATSDIPRGLTGWTQRTK